MKSKNDSPSHTSVSVNTENLSVVDNLRLRMMQVKADMPEVYMPVYEDHYGRQSDEMRIRVRECVNLRITDEEITANWETIVKKRKNREASLRSHSALAKNINESSRKAKYSK